MECENNCNGTCSVTGKPCCPVYMVRSTERECAFLEKYRNIRKVQTIIAATRQLKPGMELYYLYRTKQGSFGKEQIVSGKGTLKEILANGTLVIKTEKSEVRLYTLAGITKSVILTDDDYRAAIDAYRDEMEQQERVLAERREEREEDVL